MRFRLPRFHYRAQVQSLVGGTIIPHDLQLKKKNSKLIKRYVLHVCNFARQLCLNKNIRDWL